MFSGLSTVNCDEVEMFSQKNSNESEFKGCSSTRHGFSQEELNDLVRDLNLSKKSAELAL